jgi:hypothetical protein
MMRALDWKYLPYAGGLLDQPDWLINDLLTIEGAYHRMKDTNKESENG